MRQISLATDLYRKTVNLKGSPPPYTLSYLCNAVHSQYISTDSTDFSYRL
jgi:hypothetical protein